MRIEELIGSYENNRRQSQAGLRPLRALRKEVHAKGKVLDVVCISGDENDMDLGWFAAYVRQLPADVVSGKMEQVFCKFSSTADIEDESLAEKLLFELF